MNIVTKEDQATVKQYIDQAAKATTVVQDEQAHLKDIYDVLQAEFSVSPKIAKSLVKARMKGEVDEVKAEHDAFSDLNEIVNGSIKNEND